MECGTCHGTGKCPHCKGSGHSGYFLTIPAADASRCWACKGSGKCDDCRETAKLTKVRFRPYISVLHSQLVPRPIFAAALTGAPWRFLDLPNAVLRRSEEAQRGYVAWLCRTHYKETHGQCKLFGTINGFKWVKTKQESVILDIRGRVVGAKQEPSVPGTGSLTIGNKSIKVREDGTLTIDAATREAK